MRDRFLGSQKKPLQGRREEQTVEKNKMIKGSLFSEEELKRKPIVEKVFLKDERFVVVALEPHFNDVNGKEETTQEIADITKITEFISQDTKARIVDFKLIFEEEKKSATEDFKSYTDITTKLTNLAKDFAKAKDENDKKSLEQQKINLLAGLDAATCKMLKKKLETFSQERAKQIEEELNKIREEMNKKLEEEEEKKKQREREILMAARRRNSQTSRGSSRGSREGSKSGSPTQSANNSMQFPVNISFTSPEGEGEESIFFFS